MNLKLRSARAVFRFRDPCDSLTKGLLPQGPPPLPDLGKGTWAFGMKSLDLGFRILGLGFRVGHKDMHDWRDEVIPGFMDR